MVMIFSQFKHFVKRIPIVKNFAGRLLREYYWLLSSVPMRGPLPEFKDPWNLQISRFKDQQDFFESEFCCTVKERLDIERAYLPKSCRPFTINGLCAICQCETQFYCDFLYKNENNGVITPNWRESLICRSCGLRNRMRGCLHVFLQEFSPSADSKIYITEQLTLAYRWLRGRFGSVTGSEYISQDHQGGTLIRGVRHEDVERTSFQDQTFDIVLSFDILEHVVNLDAALSEMHRILKPGGRLFVTAPTNLNAAETLTRASVNKEGIIEHYEEPEYHGNPVDPSGGSLCFRHFGWDLLGKLGQMGFVEPEFLLWWSPTHGYLQNPQSAVTAIRPTASAK